MHLHTLLKVYLKQILIAEIGPTKPEAGVIAVPDGSYQVPNTLGLAAVVAVNVLQAPLQVMDAEIGVTVIVGAVVFCVTEIVCVNAHDPATRSCPVTV